MERVFRLLAFGFVALFAQSTLLALSPVRDPLPDLVLAAVLFVATADVAVPWGVALALAIGYFFDLLSGTPVGLHSLLFEGLYLAGRWIQRRFFLAGVLFEVTLAVGAVWLVAAAVVALRVLGQGHEPGDLGSIALATLLRSLGTGVVAPAVFWLGHRWAAGRKPTLAARPSALRGIGSEGGAAGGRPA